MQRWRWRTLSHGIVRLLWFRQQTAFRTGLSVRSIIKRDSLLKEPMKTRYVFLLLFLAACLLIGLWLGLLDSFRHPDSTVHAQGTLCNQTVVVNVAAANSQTILAGSGTDVIYVCGFVLSADT